MTCIICAKGADGHALIADKLVTTEDAVAILQSKIHIVWDKVVVAGAGTSLLQEKLTEGLQDSKIPDTKDPRKAVHLIEDTMRGIYDRYSPRLGTNYDLQVVAMGLEGFDKGDPYARLVHADGVAEWIESYKIIGHGAYYALPFMRLFYDPLLTAEELAVLGFFVISNIIGMGVDQTVGTDQLGPEMVILKTDGKPEFLNSQDARFASVRKSLEMLRYRFKLVKSIWGKLPQAYENVPPEVL
jgi:20S proteasome alpha/beta subunit